MKGLFTLVAMQLKDRVDLSFVSSKKKTIFKIVLSILKFGAITAFIWAAFFLLSTLSLVSMTPGIPQSFLLVLFTIMFILSVVVCTVGLVRSLYFAKDNQVLLTLPVTKITVFTSKIIVHYLYEYIRNLTFILPLFVAYGIINNFAFYFYPWLLVANVFVTAVPVALGALLSIPAMAITLFFKKVRFLAPIVAICVSAAAVFGVIKIILSLPENINILESWTTTYWQIQAFLCKFGEIFLPVNWFITAAVGKRYGIYTNLFFGEQFLYLLGAIALSAAVIGLSYLVVRPLYFRMVSFPFEFGRSAKTRNGKNTEKAPFISSVYKEFILLLRNTPKLISLSAIAFGMPIAILLLNSVFAAMNTKLLGNQLAVVFNVLMILLFSLSSSTDISHAVSEEGNSAYLLRSNPQPPLKLMTAKLVINAVVITLSIIASCLITGSYLGFSATDDIFIILFIVFVYLSHLIWSSEMDIMNPKNAEYQTTGGAQYNPNEIRSSIYVFVMSAIFSALTFFFLDKVGSPWIRLTVFAALFLALRGWLYVNKVKLFFTEKQA